MGGNKEGTCLKTSKRASSDTKSASTLILDFSASRTMRIKWLLLKPPVFVLILLQQLKLTKAVALFLHLAIGSIEEREGHMKQKKEETSASCY